MACTGMITMSMRELDRLKAIEAVAEARLMPWRAAERLPAVLPASSPPGQSHACHLRG